MSNYDTKSYWKNRAGIYTSKFVKQADLKNLISDTDKVDIGRLESTSINLIKLTNVVKHEVVKKNACDELDKKFNVIDTSGLVQKNRL